MVAAGTFGKLVEQLACEEKPGMRGGRRELGGESDNHSIASQPAYTPYSIQMCTEMPIRISMGCLILGVNTLYSWVFCFFKLFIIGGKEL